MEHSGFPHHTHHTHLPPLFLFTVTPGLGFSLRILLVMGKSNWVLGTKADSRLVHPDRCSLASGTRSSKGIESEAQPMRPQEHCSRPTRPQSTAQE